MPASRCRTLKAPFAPACVAAAKSPPDGIPRASFCCAARHCGSGQSSGPGLVYDGTLVLARITTNLVSGHDFSRAEECHRRSARDRAQRRSAPEYIMEAPVPHICLALADLGLYKPRQG